MLDTLTEKFGDALQSIKGKGKITEANIEEALKDVRTALLEADVNFKVVKDFIAKVKEQALGEKVLRGVDPGEQFVKILHDELARVMGSESEELDLSRSFTPILVVGLNGQGKTTFSGKLALWLRSQKQKDVLLVPADTFRPAAKDQLIVHAKNLGVDYFDSDLSKTPAEIAKEGLAYAKANGKSAVIIDTAGRLHVDSELMGELKDVKKAIESEKPEVLIVSDAMTGQEAVNVAQSFHEAIGLTGVVLTKMDSDARGGAALSIRHATGVPIRFIGTGEKMKDLELFHPDRLAGRILDMGDVVSLVEKAQKTIDEKDAENMMKRLEKGKFTVDDFMKQMDMIKNLGSFGSILKMLPGMGGMMKQLGDLSPAENEMKRMRVIIDSMTKEERDNYRLITQKDSRLKRIARGSGNTEAAVKDFIAKFKQMEQMMGMMSGLMKGGMPNLPGMGGMGGPGGMQMPGMGKKPKKKGGGKGPWGKGYF